MIMIYYIQIESKSLLNEKNGLKIIRQDYGSLQWESHVNNLS